MDNANEPMSCHQALKIVHGLFYGGLGLLLLAWAVLSLSEKTVPVPAVVLCILGIVGVVSRCPKARALHTLNLCKFLRTGVFHCGEQQIFREVFGRAGGSLAHRRLAAGKGLPFGDRRQSSCSASRVKAVSFQLLPWRALLETPMEGLR